MVKRLSASKDPNRQETLNHPKVTFTGFIRPYTFDIGRYFLKIARYENGEWDSEVYIGDGESEEELKGRLSGIAKVFRIEIDESGAVFFSSLFRVRLESTSLGKIKSGALEAPAYVVNAASVR